MSQILIAAKLHLCSIFKCCTVNAALAHLAKTFTYVSFTKCYIYVRLINISLVQWLIPLFAFSVTGHTDTLSTGLFYIFDRMNWVTMSFRYRSVNYKVVQQFLLTPAVPENPLGAQPWKKKTFSCPDLEVLWRDSHRAPARVLQVYYPTLLKENRYRVRGNAIKTPQKSHFIVLEIILLFFSSSLLHFLLMLFKFSTQLVFMGAKCPTKPGKFSESVSVEKLTPFLVPFLSLMLSSIKSIWVLSS